MLQIPQNLLTLVFPAKCLGCEKELSNPARSNSSFSLGREQPGREQPDCEPTDQAKLGFDFLGTFDHHWCRDCWRSLIVDDAQRCTKCGATLTHHNPYDGSCALCHEHDLRFDQAVAIGNYRGMLQELVIRMKNQHLEQMAIQLGTVLAFQVSQSNFFDDLDLVVPIPTHWLRRVHRGFHAAEVIAESVAHACELQSSSQVLRLVRTTKKQGTLSTAGRFKNVRNAFVVRPKATVKGLTVLLVDDVMTSGATASEAARILLKAGAAKVYIGVIARGARVS